MAGGIFKSIDNQQPTGITLVSSDSSHSTKLLLRCDHLKKNWLPPATAHIYDGLKNLAIKRQPDRSTLKF